EEIGRRLQALAAAEDRVRLERFTGPGEIEGYMKEMTKRFKLQRSDSGLAYGIMARGATLRPGPDDTVVISCNAVAADTKTELPSLSLQQQRRKVADLLPGLAEGIQMMSKDASALLILPPDLSYGEGEWPAGIPRGAPLIFTVVVHDIIAAP
ncbi:MAG: FKBP-type peptidyl-prolyl cis-trans isomerase, partial [Oleiharenicola lentus]